MYKRQVQEGDTPQTLQRRVMEQAEWELLPRALDLSLIHIFVFPENHGRARKAIAFAAERRYYNRVFPLFVCDLTAEKRKVPAMHGSIG